MYEINKSDVSINVKSKIKDVGCRIRAQRKERKMTQQDLAFYSFSDKCLISEIERGACSNITLFTIFKIAKVLGVTEDYLFTGK